MKIFALSGSIFVCGAIVLNPASAHEYTAGMKAKKYAEVESAVNTKLLADPHYAPALITKAELILIDGNEKRLDDAAKYAETCIAQHPDNSECYDVMGSVLGTKAMRGGIMSAMGYVGKIRDSFQKAVELDPKNYAARSHLLTFYLQAPGFVGGGKGKAQALIVETSKINPVAASLLQATANLSEDKFAEAENLASAAKVADVDSLIDQQRAILTNLGHAYIAQKKFADSDRIFRDLIKRYPESPDGYFGLGKSLLIQGKQKDAIASLDAALKIEENARTYYRLGQCWQQLQDKAKAINAYEKALTARQQLNSQTKTEIQDQLKSLRT